MEWLLENWYVVIGVIAILGAAGFAVYKFAGLPTTDQIKKVKEWLLYAVSIAEKELGSGTGQIKLRAVYDKFLTIPAFSTVAKVVSFELFSYWVDEALDEMRELLENNEKVKELVESK